VVGVVSVTLAELHLNNCLLSLEYSRDVSVYILLCHVSYSVNRDSVPEVNVALRTGGYVRRASI
jgi:hypothetical protein